MVDDPSVTQVVRINQRAASLHTPLVHTTVSNMNTALYDQDLSYSFEYVYQMGKFMRDTLKVQHKGYSVVVEPFAFISKGPYNQTDPERYDMHPSRTLFRL